MQFLPLFTPAVVNDYPYGYLKTTITYHIEYKKNKGYRVWSTTVNPKIWKTNKTKYSTYSEFIRLYTQEETWHIKAYRFEAYNIESYNKALSIWIFEDITKEEYDHEKAMAICLYRSILWMCSFTWFSINGNDVVNPRTLPVLTEEEKNEMKNLSYTTMKTIYERIEKIYNENYKK